MPDTTHAPDGDPPIALDVRVTSRDRAEAREVVVAMLNRAILPTLAITAVACVLAGVLAHLILPSVEAGVGLALITAALLVAIVAPVSVVVLRAVVLRRSIRLRATTLAREREMYRAAQKRDFDTQLARAFEMADSEDDAMAVVKNALELTLPDHAAEFLLADNSHAHLTRMTHTVCDDTEASCPVQSPDGCVATRGAHVMGFASSEQLTACPHLRGRPEGEISATCVPVAVMGRTVGVLHSTGPAGEEVDDLTVDRLQVLAKEAGGRLGLLRVMAETSLQATTDELTGLFNRRAMEEKLRSLRADNRDFALALCEIDGFARTRDEQGTATSEQLLRTFADVLRSTVRPEDIVARRGSEEFLVAVPDADSDDMLHVLARVRDSLVTREQDGSDSRLRISCGVVGPGSGGDLNDLLVRAETALRAAREQGGDRIVVWGDAVDAGSLTLVADADANSDDAVGGAS